MLPYNGTSFWKRGFVQVGQMAKEDSVSRQVTRRELFRMAGTGVAAAILAACQPKIVEVTKIVEKPVEKIVEKEKVVKETVVVKEQVKVEKEVTRVVEATKGPAKTFTLSIECYRAAPQDPKVPLRAGEKAIVGLGPFLDEYMSEHSNVKIEYYRKPTGVGIEWLEARMAARDAPDWWWGHGEQIWPNIHKNWALDITAWVKSPNPYMPGKRVWESYIREIGRVAVIGPDGKTYGVCLDGQGVLTFYNKKIFQDLGLKEYRTWAEAVEVWKKIKEAGFIPFGGDLGGSCCYPHWTFGHIYNQLAYDKILKYDDNGDLFILTKELVQHTLKGDFDQWPELLRMFQLCKQQAAFLPQGYRGTVDYRMMFRQGKVATYMENNEFGVTYQRDAPPFEIGYMDYPVITADQYAGARDKTVRIDGPWGNLQYFVTGYLKETEPDKLPIIKDVLMYISQPHIVGAVSAEGGMIPFVEGAPVAPNMEPWMRPYDRAVAWQSWATLSGTAYEAQKNLMGQYMFGDINDNQLLEKAKKSWGEEVQKLLDNNPDWKDISALK